jgi:hypothetical protein
MSTVRRECDGLRERLSEAQVTADAAERRCSIADAAAAQYSASAAQYSTTIETLRRELDDARRELLAATAATDREQRSAAALLGDTEVSGLALQMPFFARHCIRVADHSPLCARGTTWPRAACAQRLRVERNAAEVEVQRLTRELAACAAASETVGRLTAYVARCILSASFPLLFLSHALSRPH